VELIKQNTQTKIIKSLIVIFLGSIILAISAKIKIPFYPVPMTMQTFVVLFLGVGFGYKIAISAVGLYLIEGILGLPVFSNSPERGVGLVYFTGPTMGYLIGFLSASFLASFIKFKDNYLMIFFKLVLAVSTIYILGILWLGTLIGWDKPVIELGVTPFLLAELFKIVLLTVVTKNIFKLRKFI
jgi:biotin transport system substrate-specific component